MNIITYDDFVAVINKTLNRSTKGVASLTASDYVQYFYSLSKSFEGWSKLIDVSKNACVLNCTISWKTLELNAKHYITQLKRNYNDGTIFEYFIRNVFIITTKPYYQYGEASFCKTSADCYKIIEYFLEKQARATIKISDMLTELLHIDNIFVNTNEQYDMISKIDQFVELLMNDKYTHCNIIFDASFENILSYANHKLVAIFFKHVKPNITSLSIDVVIQYANNHRSIKLFKWPAFMNVRYCFWKKYDKQYVAICKQILEYGIPFDYTIPITNEVFKEFLVGQKNIYRTKITQIMLNVSAAMMLPMEIINLCIDMCLPQ